MNNPKVNVVVSGHRNEYHSTYKTYILRGGVPFADQIIMPNTKYVIKYDFDLGGRAFDIDFTNADTHIVAEVTYYYIPFIADGSKYMLMDDTLVFVDAEWNGLSAREIKPEKGTLFMIASITGGLHKNGYAINVVTVPENCILEFDGGSLDNGVIVGQDTVFINVGDVEIWGKNLTREGTWREHSGGGGSGEEDKPYDPEAHSGLGRKTLQLKDGSNILTQEDFDEENTVYVIQYDFDLNGETIEIPEGCTLKFDGGTINNGKLISNNTKLLNYDGNSNALYSLYYSIDNELLNNCYTDLSDFHITECHRFVDETVNYEGLTEYQNIVRYGDYLFLLGYPWVKAGATDPTHYPLFIRVFTLDKYRLVGTVYTNVQSHANGATIAGNTLYVCVSDGHKYNGEYINPDRKCLHTFNCDAIVNSAQNASVVPISNGRIDLSRFESNIGSEIEWVEGVDYDEVNEEFAIDFSGIIVVADRDFNYIRKTANYKTYVRDNYNYQIGDQDISYKNGIVYGLFCRYDNGSSSQHNAAHTTVITIDTLSGNVIDVKDMLNDHSWWESQGAFKDPDNEEQLWTLMVERRYDTAINAVTVFTICKIAPTKLTLKDTRNSVPTDSYIKPLINNGKYLNIYVDEAATNTIQDGTETYPYKSLHQAIHTTMTLSENVTFVCKRGGTYEAQFTYVVNRAIRIQAYGTGNNPIIKVNGSFINCHISIKDVTIVPIIGMGGHQGATFFLTNCVFLFSNSMVLPLNYDESIIDVDNYHNKNNWQISTGFISAQCSYIDINYCKFVGLSYILYALRVLNGTITDISFESVTNLLVIPEKGTACINVKNMGITWYTEITKLINAVGTITTEPFVRFCGWTINNTLIALIISKKNGGNGLTSYKQLDTRVFTETDAYNEVVALVEDEYGVTPSSTPVPLRIEGTLEQGEYLYNDGRFEDSFYHILGCATRGTAEQRPTASYPFLVKTGMGYWDFSTGENLVWNGVSWINGGGGSADVYTTLEENANINNIYTPGKYLCLDQAIAQTIIGNPFKDSYPSGFTLIVMPAGDTSELGRRIQILLNFSEYKTAIRYSKNLVDSQRDGYYSWRFIDGKLIDDNAGSLKTLSVGDSILRGYRNGDKAFFPYITTNYKQNAISGARLTTKAGYGIKDIPQQLVDEASYVPDVIIAGTGVNDWALDAPLGVAPTTLVTTDVQAAALDRTTVYGAVQYLFYQMIKKFPKAKRYFISTIKFDCNVSLDIQGKYIDTNSQGYSYADMLEGIKKICLRYGVVYIDILNNSFVNTEFATYKAPTGYDDTWSQSDKDIWNATYYADADGLHPTDLCYREVFAAIVNKELM